MSIYETRQQTESSLLKVQTAWLMTYGTILMKRSVRSTKFEPLIEEVQLLEGSNYYAHIRFSSGSETTVSTKQLAPHPNSVSNDNTCIELDVNVDVKPKLKSKPESTPSEKVPQASDESPSNHLDQESNR